MSEPICHQQVKGNIKPTSCNNLKYSYKQTLLRKTKARICCGTTCNHQDWCLLRVKLHLTGNPVAIEVRIPPAMRHILRLTRVQRPCKRNAEVALFVHWRYSKHVRCKRVICSWQHSFITYQTLFTSIPLWHSSGTYETAFG